MKNAFDELSRLYSSVERITELEDIHIREGISQGKFKFFFLKTDITDNSLFKIIATKYFIFYAYTYKICKYTFITHIPICTKRITMTLWPGGRNYEYFVIIRH